MKTWKTKQLKSLKLKNTILIEGLPGIGNVGIGTSGNPQNKLHVEGAIRTEGILNSDGLVSEQSYRFNSDPDTGMFNAAANQLAFVWSYCGGILFCIQRIWRAYSGSFIKQRHRPVRSLCHGGGLCGCYHPNPGRYRLYFSQSSHPV